MIAWRTLACSAAVLCLALTGCGDDIEPGGFSAAGSAGMNSDGGSSSSSTGDSSTGTPGTSNPSTGSDTSSTSFDPTTGAPSTTTLTTGEPDTTTGEPDTTTGPNPTTMTTQTTDPAGCGNGQIDPNEQCDGANLNGFTCESLGNAGGSLGCDPVTCTFDTSMCMGNSDPSTSG